MWIITKRLFAALLAVLGLSANGYAAHPHSAHHGMHDSHAGSLTPIPVMGEHMHARGGWMFSYRFMHMEMEDNRDGSSDISPATIVTTIPNRFSAIPGQPPTLRVVPTEMSTDMHMFGLMYAPSDKVTLMAMLPYLKKEMDHTTFMGGAGTAQLGTFTTRTEGIGDARLSGLIGLYDDAIHHVHANLGLGVPTGSNTRKGSILTPMGARPKVRLPYPMQLGSGTYDLLAGLTYTGSSDGYFWGAQYAGVFRTGSDEGYTLGDTHNVTAWLARQFMPMLSGSVRINYLDIDNIDGIDSAIVLPVQTADPDRQGKQRWDLAAGLSLLGTEDGLRGHRLALEVSRPLDQDLDGPQLKADWMFTLGYQKTW